MSDKSIWSVLADVQERIEQPKLNAAVNYGATKFRYADLGELWRVVRDATKGSGLFVHHTEAGGCIQVVAHLGEQAALLAQCPANLVGKPQDVGSALTYAKRYSLAMAFGLVAEEDDDGQRGSAQNVQNRPKPQKGIKGTQAAQKPVSGDSAASQGQKDPRKILADACAAFADATGQDAKEVMQAVAARDDFDGTAETMLRIAEQLTDLGEVSNG